MTEPTLPAALGNYAAGERFWDREREVEEISQYLAGGQSVLVTGPRRVGKTSVVRQVLSGLNPSMDTLFIDVEQHNDPVEMFASLAATASGDAAFWRRIVTWFGKRLSAVADRIDAVNLGVVKVDLEAAMAGSWRDDGRAIVEALAGGDRPTVIAIDEFPLLVDRTLRQDRTEGELLMGLLRALADEFGNVRWLISGSIGLEPVLHQAGLTGMITFLRSYPIDAWDEDTTEGAVSALARATHLELATGAAAAVHDQLGLGVPYHVQLLMDEVRRDADRRDDRRIGAADVARVYSGPFLSSAVRAHMLHLETRLDKVLGEGDALRLARDLLTQAAVADVLTAADAAVLAEDLVEDDSARAATLRQVLEILEHDAYLSWASDGWRYRSRVVRDWWRQGNEFGFVAPEKRRRRQ
jgi:uncharacterized protein